MPLLLAGAKLLGGQCALFAVVPLLTGLGVLVTYGIGTRLVSPWGGVIAAWLVAASPIVIGIALEPLTDVPVMTAWGISLYLLLARIGGRLSPAIVGLAAGIAILIRPNLVPLSIPIGMWDMIRRQTDGDSRVLSSALFALGVLPSILLIAFLNDRLYGSPLSSGYGTLNDLYAWSHVGPNLRRYFGWFMFAETPVALAGLAALLVPTRRLWTTAADLRIVPILALFVALLWGHYLAYEVYDSWGFLRFLLPSWPLIMSGFAAVLLAASDGWLARLPRAVAQTVVTLLVVLLGVWTFSPTVRGGAFNRQAAAPKHHSVNSCASTRSTTAWCSCGNGRGRSGFTPAGRLSGTTFWIGTGWTARSHGCVRAASTSTRFWIRITASNACADLPGRQHWPRWIVRSSSTTPPARRCTI